jgi:hypothetical protein
MGKFSPLVDEKFRQKIQLDIKRYKETGKLPSQSSGGK